MTVALPMSAPKKPGLWRTTVEPMTVTRATTVEGMIAPRHIRFVESSLMGSHLSHRWVLLALNKTSSHQDQRCEGDDEGDYN